MTTFADCTDDQLTQGIRSLASLMNATQAQMFAMVAELSSRDAHKADGHRNMGSWLAATIGVSGHTGNAWAKAATALPSRPHLASTFAEGALSFDRLKPAITLASTPELDEHWAEEALKLEAATLERLARQARDIPDKEDGDERRRDQFRSWWQERRCKISAELGPEAGAKLDALMERLIKELPPNPDGTRGSLPEAAARAFENLLDLALAALNPTAAADRTVVSVHTDLDVLLGRRDGPSMVGVAPIGSSVLHKLCCDAILEIVVHDAEGNVVGIGRASRVTPQWLRRHLLRRDGTCRFPGCDQRMLLHSHHIRWWTRDEGPTDAPNLAMLCTFHHDLVHTGGWTLSGDAERGELTFRRPDGRIYAPSTAPVERDLRDRYLEAPPQADSEEAMEAFLDSKECTRLIKARARALRFPGNAGPFDPRREAARLARRARPTA